MKLLTKRYSIAEIRSLGRRQAAAYFLNFGISVSHTNLYIPSSQTLTLLLAYPVGYWAVLQKLCYGQIREL